MAASQEGLLREIRSFHADHKKFNTTNWERIGLVPSMTVGEKILDVGIGNGSLLNLLYLEKKYSRLVGIDYRKHSTQKLISSSIEYYDMNIVDLKFKDSEFDTVICMEVLEHLGDRYSNSEAQQWLGWNPDSFYQGILELRRVAKKRLILTIPFEEEFPLFHYNKSTGHKRIFNKVNIPIWFPDGEYFTFYHWLFVIIDNPRKLTFLDSNDKYLSKSK